MNTDYLFDSLEKNGQAFKDLLEPVPMELRTWKIADNKWCLLEICCHLYDEEREDFCARTRHVLESPDKELPKFDPIKWVTERKYLEQDYDAVLKKFLDERESSVRWLRSLKDPQWNNVYEHPKFGSMSARYFLSNWLAHDYLHIRQIIGIKFQYLKQNFNKELNYAGDW